MQDVRDSVLNAIQETLLDTNSNIESEEPNIHSANLSVQDEIQLELLKTIKAMQVEIAELKKGTNFKNEKKKQTNTLKYC